MIKVGISGQGFKANGDSKRAQPQVEKFKEIYGNSVEAIIIEKGLTREEALALEQKITDKHAVRNKGKMPTRYHQLPRPSVSNKDIYEARYSEAHNVSVKGRNY